MQQKNQSYQLLSDEDDEEEISFNKPSKVSQIFGSVGQRKRLQSIITPDSTWEDIHFHVYQLKGV